MKKSRLPRRWVLGFWVLAALCANVARAQCVPSTPVSFEPNPPGPASPRNVAQLSPNSMYHLRLFQAGNGGPWRILMQESYGYSVLDLTTPASPSVVRYDYMPFDTNSVAIHGDGQNYIQTLAIAPDGQRAAFSVTSGGQANPPWNTVLGSADANSGVQLWGDTAPAGAVGDAVLVAGGRYIHYGLTSFNLYASDVTTLPGTWASNNVAYETSSFPGGASLAVAGNYLAYVTGAGTIQVIDASNPGLAGNITASLPRTTIGSSNFFGRSPGAVKTAVDPANSRQLWILVELAALTGENSPSYALMYVTEDGSGNFSAPVSAGPSFRVPSVAGENWSPAGSSSALATHQGSIYVLMWANRKYPTPYQYVLYSTTVVGWGAQQPSTVSASGFTLGDMTTLSSGTTLYAYLATGGNGFVIPMTCQSPNAKATSTLSATNPTTSIAVNSGDAVVYGETLSFQAGVLPTPTVGQLTDLIAFPTTPSLPGWNIDFDFHAGNTVVEDNGATATPRLKNPDNDQFAGQLQYPPPAPFNVIGPCDPRVASGNPQTGVNCWQSVTTNGNQTASGAPDFTGAEAAGQLTPLVLALEANNHNGSNGPTLFTINWKRPTINLVSNSILSSDPLAVNTSDPALGHPGSAGYTWWFGDNPNGLTQATCTGPSCNPTVNTPGSHYYVVQATYPQIGYSTPPYVPATGTTLQYAVSTFVPLFTVNGSSTGPIGATTGATITVVNSSKRATGTTGAYTYCLVPAGRRPMPLPAPRSL